MIFLSNGSGEDAIATSIIQHLPPQRITAFPMVGAGAAYEKLAGIEILGSQPNLPSGGLTNEDWRLWISDLRNGFVIQKYSQLLKLRALRKADPARVLVCVGDLMPVIFARLAGFTGTVFVGTAKSNYHHAYSGLEAWVLKNCCRQVFTRDQPTAKDLATRGVGAQWLGNPMMDDLAEAYQALSIRGPASAIAIFPGSRAATYEELPRLLGWFNQISSQVGTVAHVAVAESIDLERLLNRCSDWQVQETDKRWLLVNRQSGATALLFLSDMSGCLRHCRIALGVAGTAHEQAAGLGIPVIAPHPTADPQKLGWYRGRQKGLLGDALWVVRPDQVVESALYLLNDSAEWQRRSTIGFERMGPPGGAAGIASWLASNASHLRA
jgi:uncharacterized protein (TIGR03492 family)